MDKYDISGKHMYENTYDDEETRLRDEFYRQKNYFYKEQLKLEEKSKDQKVDVTLLANFKNTAIF